MTDGDRSPDREEALARAVHTVYGAAPEEFVAVRKEQVTRLRAEGMKDEAKQVGALRKPSVAAAAVNALVRAADPVVGRLNDVGARMRHAQSALDMAALAALREERDGVLTAWVAAARTHAPGGSLTPAVESEVRDTAVAALADAAATEVVTSGNLTRALSYSGFGEVDVADAVARTSTGVVLTRIDGGRAEEAQQPGAGADGADEADRDDTDADTDAGGEVDDEGDPDAGKNDDDGPDAEVYVEDEAEVEKEAGGQTADQAEAREAEVEVADREAEDKPASSQADDRTTERVRSSAADRVTELEMELDEAEKVVAAARATRKSAAQADAEAEREVTVGQEQVAQAERLLAAARKHLEKAEERRLRTQEALEVADRELAESRARRDETRAALEEAEDA